MTTEIARRRRPRGRYPKTQGTSAAKRPKLLPEYLEADEVNAIIRAAPNPKARLLMLEQWRAGLRVSEALDLEVRDLALDGTHPTLRVRSGKGGRSRIIPVHPELHSALTSALSYGSINQGRIIVAHRTTALRWVKAAVKRAEEMGALPAGASELTPSDIATSGTTFSTECRSTTSAVGSGTAAFRRLLFISSWCLTRWDLWLRYRERED